MRQETEIRTWINAAVGWKKCFFYAFNYSFVGNQLHPDGLCGAKSAAPNAYLPPITNLQSASKVLLMADRMLFVDYLDPTSPCLQDMPLHM